MDDKQKQALRDAGMSEDEINELAAKRVEIGKTEAFLADIEVATVSEQKKMVQQKANYLTYKAALTEDKYEAKQTNRVAWRLKSAAKQSGGFFEM